MLPCGHRGGHTTLLHGLLISLVGPKSQKVAPPLSTGAWAQRESNTSSRRARTRQSHHGLGHGAAATIVNGEHDHPNVGSPSSRLQSSHDTSRPPTSKDQIRSPGLKSSSRRRRITHHLAPSAMHVMWIGKHRWARNLGTTGTSLLGNS